MIGLIICLLAILTYVQISAQKQILEKELDRRIVLMKEILVQRGATLADNLGRQAENDIAAFNFSNITEVLDKAVAEDKELTYAILMDASNVAHIHTLQPELQQETMGDAQSLFAARQVQPTHHEYQNNHASFMEFVIPLRISTRPWGVLRLGLSLDLLNEEIVHSREEIAKQIRAMVRRSVVTSFILIILGASIVLYISTKLSRPLTNLTESANQLATGNFAAAKNIVISSKDEVGVLSAAFIKMSENLKSSYEKLEDHSRNLEQKVDERTKELSQTLDNLKQTQSQLVVSEKMASLGGLVAGVAHEINTPIGIGVTAASHLEEKATTFNGLFKNGRLKKSDLEKFFDITIQGSEMILSNLNRASQLIQSFKQVAVDQSSEEKRIFNVREYIEEILMSLRPKLKKTSHTVDIACEEAIEMLSYPGSLSQVMTNLIMNSLIHAYDDDDKGRIVIDIKRDGGFINLTYTDDGRGIEEACLTKIFDPFFTTKRGQGGSGLGLHLVYNLVTQKLKGQIKCESKVGAGAKFYLKLPVRI